MVIPFGAIIVVIILMALLWWVLQQVSLPAPVKTVIIVCVVVLAVVWLINAFNIDGLTMRVGMLQPVTGLA